MEDLIDIWMEELKNMDEKWKDEYHIMDECKDG